MHRNQNQCLRTEQSGWVARAEQPAAHDKVPPEHSSRVRMDSGAHLQKSQGHSVLRLCEISCFIPFWPLTSVPNTRGPLRPAGRRTYSRPTPLTCACPCSLSALAGCHYGRLDDVHRGDWAWGALPRIRAVWRRCIFFDSQCPSQAQDPDIQAFIKFFGTPYMGAVINLCMLITFILGLFVTLVVNRWCVPRKKPLLLVSLRGMDHPKDSSATG